MFAAALFILPKLRSNQDVSIGKRIVNYGTSSQGTVTQQYKVISYHQATQRPGETLNA